ncbi:MAG TPA: DNA mismatch repair endonuclease MutL [Bacteroidia bacterium]|nr:DNA mismatch repair endonuclease MutL [Bacteroidia bacterium]
MADVIKLLPDHVINQIAAGEVIQRPASAVKELLENSIDAGSTKIRLIVKEAGKSLIQVIDNGIGMSETDARLAFEKHATSKISTAEDIFTIHTKGFRGEALASIAAVASVELKTRKRDNDVGCLIDNEYGKFLRQEACQCEPGSSFTIKNLFFNIPARKNFLKSDPVELRHIIDELQRVALAHPEIEFSMYNNTTQVFHLPSGTLRQRIINLFGNNYGEKIAPISEETTILKINGFIGKPEYAKKTRGEQFFFVNNRFIKNNYLNHAVQSAYNELIAKDNAYPSYFIFLDLPPNKIDVNIHPTKTEIKFEDESAIYAILKATIKKSLGQHNIIPPMDFEQEMSIQIMPVKSGAPLRAPQIDLTPGYNPFVEEEKKKNIKPYIKPQSDTRGIDQREFVTNIAPPVLEHHFAIEQHNEIEWTQQIGTAFIVAAKQKKLLIIDQQLAWERIFYEEALTSIENRKSIPSQKELFPQTIQFPAADFVLLSELMPDIRLLGFDLSDFGKQTFIVYGIPSGVESGSVQGLLEEILEHFKQGQSKELKKPRAEVLSKIYARRMAWKNCKLLKKEEREELLNRLFNCKSPATAPEGKRIFIEMEENQLMALLKTDTR